MTNLTVFGTRPQDAIFLPQIPYAVRNDCQCGQFKIGDEDFRGNSIDISIIKASQFFGTLGKTANAQWLQLWFIPAPGCDNLPSNTVCVTYLKSRSISQFSQKITELMASGEPALGIFTASFEKHSSDVGTYYSVVWGWRERKSEEEKKQLEAIASFMQSEPVLFDSNTSDRLVCIDGMSQDELQMLARVAREEEQREPEPAGGTLAKMSAARHKK